MSSDSEATETPALSGQPPAKTELSSAACAATSSSRVSTTSWNPA
jgi:hypothetical protein